MIYHYTTIDTLKLILESEKIRFNRLDRVDDADEADLYAGLRDLSSYYFVSCWTKNAEENLGLWNCYARSSPGVRIGVPDMPFFTMQPDPRNTRGIRAKITPGAKIDSFVSLDEMFNPNYFFMSNFILDTHFEKQIIYLETDELKEKYRHFLRLDIREKQKDLGLIMDGVETCRYKHKRWAFQEEFRFVLNILPQNPLFLEENAHLSPSGNYIKGVIDCFNRKIKNEIHHYDLKLSENALNNMEIVISPYAKKQESQHILDVLASFVDRSFNIRDSEVNIRLRN